LGRPGPVVVDWSCGETDGDDDDDGEGREGMRVLKFGRLLKTDYGVAD
jgi:hypothetical protein